MVCCQLYEIGISIGIGYNRWPRGFKYLANMFLIAGGFLMHVILLQAWESPYALIHLFGVQLKVL